MREKVGFIRAVYKLLPLYVYQIAERKVNVCTRYVQNIRGKKKIANCGIYRENTQVKQTEFVYPDENTGYYL